MRINRRLILALMSPFACLALSARAAIITWDGGGADSNASTSANWSPDVVPGPGDDIILNTTSHKNMTWNMTNLVIGSWTQLGYLGTVTVATVYGTTGFTNLNIIGDCIISNGVWTQTRNPSVAYEVNRLSATIGGNLTIGPNGVIDVTSKGYGMAGPGYGSGSGYGGEGGHDSWAGLENGGPCYGSIVAPTNLGTGASGGGSQNFGGGAILLRVSGTIRNDGLLCADALPNVIAYYAGSGGSVFLTAGALTGAGTIRANGGSIMGGTRSPGGGGRISLVVTNAGADFSLYTGPVLALSGTSGSSAGAGTIYRQRAADRPGRGTVVVANNTVGYTDLPPGPPNVTNEVNFVSFFVTNAAILRLTNDFTVGDIWLDSTNAKLDLNFRTLTVRTREHPLGPGSVTNAGSIIWLPGRVLFKMH